MNFDKNSVRETIYASIESSCSYEECALKLLMKLKPDQKMQFCRVFLDCCAEQSPYKDIFGCLGKLFCKVDKKFIAFFEEIFSSLEATYVDLRPLSNVCRFYAYLLQENAITWDVFKYLKLNGDTCSETCVFIEIFIHELVDFMGIGGLEYKLKESASPQNLLGIFPRDNEKNTRFAINYFKSIGLDALTGDLQYFLKASSNSVKEEKKLILSTSSSALPDIIEPSICLDSSEVEMMMFLNCSSSTLKSFDMEFDKDSD